MTASRNDLNEPEDQLIAKYVGGWKLFIHAKKNSPTYYILTLDDAINMAWQIKKAVVKSSRFASMSAEAASRDSLFVNKFVNSANAKDKGPLLKTPREKPHTPLDPFATQVTIKCYRCQAFGHKSNTFPSH